MQTGTLSVALLWLTCEMNMGLSNGGPWLLPHAEPRVCGYKHSHQAADGGKGAQMAGS